MAQGDIWASGMTYTQKLIRGIRENAGMSRNRFAETLGFAVNTVYQWEHGLNQPSFESVRLISRHFNIQWSLQLEQDIQELENNND